MAIWPISRSSETSDGYAPDRSGNCGARRLESAAAGFPHALRLLEGRCRSVCPRLRPQFRCSHRGHADELHLRPASNGHRGSGLGRPFPASARCAASRSPFMATAARCATFCMSTTRSTPILRHGAGSTMSSGRAFNLGGGPANAISLRQLLGLHRSPDRSQASRSRIRIGGPAISAITCPTRGARQRNSGLRAPLPWREGVARLLRVASPPDDVDAARASREPRRPGG